MLLYHWRPKRQEIQEKPSSFEATVSWRIIISRPSKGQKEESDQMMTILTPFKTPGQDRERVWHSRFRIWLYLCSSTQPKKWIQMSNPKCSSHSSHHVQHFSPRSPSSSPPAQLSSREKLVSPNAEDHLAPKHQIIRPQDVNTQMTSGLAALIQETSPLAPYKIQCSAKRKARQTLSNMR